MIGLYYVMFDDGKVLHFHSKGFRFRISAYLYKIGLPFNESYVIVKIYS